MKPPAVSILIPTYNYARYLPEAVDSVLAQDFTDFELIIADDASTDDTETIGRAYAAKDSRIRFYRHAQNLGMVENWNWCLRQACGKYIKYLLGDDCFKQPYTLRRMVDTFEQNPDIALVTSARTLIDADSRVSGLWNPLGGRDRQYPGRALTYRCLEQNVNLIGEPTAVFFRREDGVRGFDPSFRQLVDLEMWMHLLQKGDLFYLHEPLCCFRRHSGQQTEVNRIAGLHLRELIRLGCYMPSGRRRRMHFRWIYRMQKTGREEYQNAINLLRKEFSLTVYLSNYIEYKIWRLFFNIRRILQKNGIN